MSDDGDWGAGGEYLRRPIGAKPIGAKPIGAKPIGAKPIGAKPIGAKPIGAKPIGAKPIGAKPFGAKPIGAKLYDEEGAFFDPDEWGTDIAELVCDRSAVVRLGATLAFGTDELQIPASFPVGGFRAPGVGSAAPGAAPPVALSPGEWRLEASVAVPLGLLFGLGARPEFAETVKSDLAQELAERADEALLVGASAGGPRGISNLVNRTGPAAGGGQRLTRLRDIVRNVRAAVSPRRPGWVLHPAALDTISRFLTRNGITQNTAAGRAVDTLSLLRVDGFDGGTLLGFPFVTSADAGTANRPGVYFGADWEEAWIGLDPSFVTVGASVGAAAGQLVITAAMPLDFALRRTTAFAWAIA